MPESNMPALTSIRDNHTFGKVGDFLIDKIKSGANLSVVSAYFTIYAYQKLKDELDNIDRLNFLFGEPSYLKSIDPSKVNRRDFKIEDDQLVIPIESRLSQKLAAKECSEWIKDKVDIKSMVDTNLLHGKLYLIENPNQTHEAIMGSSNFTMHGLGFADKPNIELNMITQDRRDWEDLKNWFDLLWNDDKGLVEDVKDEVLKYLEKLYVDNEPEFIYFKTLFHLFEKYLADQEKGGLLNEKTGFFESEVWEMLYDFQRDGVKGAINKILTHNGCIIADSVGLGKTFEALAIIRYFELLNLRVLVLCPKKLVSNWTLFQAHKNNALNPFRKDRFNYTVLFHTDVGRKSGLATADGIDLEHFNWGNFDLVVIDESHNFRGNPIERTIDGDTKMNRAMWLMEKIIKSGAKTKVLMLSATPVNNNLRDLRNQIHYITEGSNDALLESFQIQDIAQTIKNAQTQFTLWADIKKNPNRQVKDLIERLDTSFFKLLDELTIARSRKHIKNYYDIDSVGQFPERMKPRAIYPAIDLQDRFLTYDNLNKKILEYKLSIFNPSAYVLPEYLHIYEEIARTQVLAFTQLQRENFLIGMMKVNFLKRLESSIESFQISMDRTIKKIESLIQKIKQFQKQLVPALEESLEDYEPSEDELEELEEEQEQWQVGKKLKFKLSHLDLDRWLKDLDKDLEALNELYVHAFAVVPERDAKLHQLKQIISSKIKEPINDHNRKILLFTAFGDTAHYLYTQLKDWAKNELKINLALVTGTDTKSTLGKNSFEHILTNFSPISKSRSKMNLGIKEEIDLLIATDCISEGQNLQDCDCVINYDIHWNPVRIIQRFGRIDRIGSKNKKIQLINFWPTKDLDQYINLKERVEARMALVDVTATGEDNVLASGQIEELIKEDLKFRNKQLKRLRDEVLDLEELDESISLTDFTLDDFRIELMNYLENNREKLKEAPFGLYAVVPALSGDFSNLIDINKYSASEQDIIKPGIVYCLKQKGDTSGNDQVNPLQPYFLVYIREDGTVRFNYTHPKQILEIYRLLCQGKTAPFEKLCSLFDEETGQGEQMEKYSALLESAIKAIRLVFTRRAVTRLTTDRDALLIPTEKLVKEANQFELVTWLVLK